MKIKAVIFDLDGTLIDTETIYRKLWPEACRHFGYELSDERMLKLRSLGHSFTVPLLKSWFGVAFDYYEVRDYRMKLFRAYVEAHGIEKKKGADELLSKLHEAGITAAIATATDIERASSDLDTAGYDRSLFDRIITAGMVKVGKPEPDVYLYAAEALGFAPEECLAVEDAPNGIQSAFRAGCHTAFVPDQTEPTEEDLKYAEIVVPSLSDLIPYIFGTEE